MADYRTPPRWPEWIEAVFTTEGVRLLEMTYETAKLAGLERSKRLSAEDLATAAVACFLVCGRTDLLRRIG